MAATTTDGEEFRDRARRLDPAEVRRLSRLSPARSTLSIAQTWGLAAAAIAIAARWPHPLVVVAAWIAVAGAQHGLAILAHQSAHYRLYETRWLNDLVGRLCAIPLGVSVITYRVIHRTHHNHLYSPIDPDLALMAGYPRGPGYLAKKLLKDLSGITTIKNYLYFFGKPPTRDHRGAVPEDDTSARLRSAAKRDRAIVVGVNVALAALLVGTGLWRAYVVLWLVPLITLLQAILRLRAVAEHGATPDGRIASPPPDPRRAARTTVCPWYVRWIVFPHDMNYHVEHHLYPSVPHYRLRECHDAMRSAGLLDDAEVVHGFGATLRRIFARAA